MMDDDTLETMIDTLDIHTEVVWKVEVIKKQNKKNYSTLWRRPPTL